MLGASVDLGTSKHIGKAKGALIMGGMFGKNPLTLEQQLALVEPMPKQTGYKDRYRSDKDPFRIGREFRQLTVFPNDFWDNVEAFYAQNFGSVADFDMDPFYRGLLRGLGHRGPLVPRVAGSAPGVEELLPAAGVDEHACVEVQPALS